MSLADLRDLIEQRDLLSVEQLQEVITTVRALADKHGVRIGDPARANPAELAAEQTLKRRYKYIYQHARHLDAIAEEVRAFADGERGDYRGLLVAVPPQHGKSSLLSTWTPIWLLKRNPSLKVLLASYGAEKAVEWSREVRDFFIANPDFGVALDRKVLAASGWTTIQGGGMWAAGVGGPLTGRSADVFVCDDPYKDAAEAYSQVIRDKVRTWFNTVALTRLSAAGFIVVVHTLWSEDDLISNLMKASKDGSGLKFKSLILPAIAGDNDPIGREPGEALWEEKKPLQWLLETKKALSPFEWSAVFQQAPAPEEGAAVKRSWWKFFPATDCTQLYEQADQVIFAFDLALKETETGSFNVGLVLARKGANTYVINFWRERCDFPTVLAKVRMWSNLYPRALAKVVEDKAAGPALIATLAKEIPGVVPMPAQGSKLVRLNAVVPLIHAGNVFLPHPDMCPWSETVQAELASFPASQHDDIVDTISHGLRYLYPSVWQHLDKLEREGAESQRDADQWGAIADRQKAWTKSIREAKAKRAEQIGDGALVWKDSRRTLC